MDQELRALRREVSGRESGRGKRFAAELRGRLLDWVGRRRRQGASLSAIASELSLPTETVRRFAALGSRAERLVEVAVVADGLVERVRVMGPSGFCVEALTLEQAAALLRMLR